MLSYFIAFLIAFFLHPDELGFRFAEKCGAKQGTWKYDILVNLVVNTVFSVIMTVVMHTFSACLIGGQPISSIPGGFAEMIVPIWICCFIVSLLTQRPAIRLAKKICREGDRP